MNKKTINKIAPIFIFFLLIISLTIRLTTHTYPYGVDDSNRDYLVAHHIVEYNEYPLRGPFAAVTQSRNSPSYYYVLAAFALIKDDPIFLRIISSLMQVVTIFIVYQLAKKLFGLKTAFLCAILLSFNHYSLIQSAFIWQPWVMQPFANISYLLLLLGYQKRNYILLSISVLLFIFAGSLHTSVFAISPIYFFVLFKILKNQKANHYQSLGIIVAILTSFLALYLPVVYASSHANLILPSLQNHMLSLNPLSQVPFQFMKNVLYFAGGSFLFGSVNAGVNNLIAISLLLALVYYFFLKKQKMEKQFSLLLLIPIVFIILCFAVVRVRVFGETYGIHYFTPVYGLFIILLSQAFITIFKKNKYAKIAGIFLLSCYLAFFLSHTYQKLYVNKPTYALRYLNDPAINAIKNDILTLKNIHSYKDFAFFYIDAAGGDRFGWKYNATVWSVLERELKTKLVRTDDYNQAGFEQLNTKSSDYVFVVCPVSAPGNKECKNKFISSHPNYSYAKTTFMNQDYKIDLMKKN